MNIRPGVEKNPYVVSLYEPHTILRNYAATIHLENTYSIPFATGVSQAIQNIIKKIDNENLKDLSKDLNKYEKAFKLVKSKKENLVQLQKLSKNSIKKKTAENIQKAQEELSNIETDLKIQRTVIEGRLIYVKEQIAKYKAKKQTHTNIEAWRDWYNLYQSIKPEDFEDDPNILPPPADTVSTDDAPRMAVGNVPRRGVDDSANGVTGGAQHVKKKQNIVKRPDINPDDQDKKKLQEDTKNTPQPYFVDNSESRESKREESVTHEHVDIMNHTDTGHDCRHHKHEFMKTVAEKELWHKLFSFSKKVANESKYFVYRTLTKYLRKGILNDFLTLGCSAVALAENEGKPFTVQETIHQIVRSFLHMHDNQLQAIIWVYLRFYYGITTEQEAFSVLVFAVQTELKHNFDQNEPWDVGFLYQLTKTLSDKKNSVFMALHNGLKALENRVIFIEWIGDWKNFMKLHRCEHGPLKQIIEGCKNVTIHCSDMTITSYPFKCPYCRKVYPSLHLLRKHLIFRILGTEEIPRFQVFKTTIEGKEEIKAAPFAIEDLNLHVIHKGLLYEDKSQDERNNLFFITTDRHFRNCNLLDIEDNYRQRIRDAFFLQDEQKIYTGNLISVGIDKVECQRFIIANFQKFKSSLQLIKTLDTNLKDIERRKQELLKSIPKIRSDIIQLNAKVRYYEEILKRPKIDEKTKENKEQEIIKCKQTLRNYEQTLEHNKNEFQFLESKRKLLLNQMVDEHKTTFNFYYLSENNESNNLIFEMREKSVSKLISYCNEVTFLDSVWSDSASKERKESDILRYTLLIFAIFSLSKMKEIIESVLEPIKTNVQTQINTGIKISIENSTQEGQVFVSNLAMNIDKNFISHGLLKMTRTPNSNHTQTFMSPFFSILLNNWLKCFKDDVGFEFKYSEKEFQVQNLIIEKIEKEWKYMQQLYNSNGNSSTYKWHCDLSTEQLNLKEDDALFQILKWKIFVLKANNCSMNSILQLTTLIFNDKENIQLLIKNRSKLWKKIILCKKDDVFKDEIIKDDEKQTSLYLSGIDQFEEDNFGELIKTDSTLDFFSIFFENESMVDIQAKMFQCAKLLLFKTDNDEISHDNLLTIKWFDKQIQKPVQINIPSEVPMRIAGKNHIKRFQKNRDFSYNQQKFTYTNGNFQTHFFTFDERDIHNKIISIVSFFTNFSANKLKSEIFEHIKNLTLQQIRYIQEELDISMDEFKLYVENETDGLELTVLFETLLICILVNVVKRPICVYKNVDESQNLILSGKFYFHKYFIQEPVFGEPIHILDFQLLDENYLAGLVVIRYSMNQMQKTYDIEKLLYNNVLTWNSIYQDPGHSENSMHMSLCKQYLYLIYKKIRNNIPAQTISKLHETLTGKNLKKFLSMEEDLNIVCDQYPMSTEEYEALISSSKYDLLEDCYKIFLKVKSANPNKRTKKHSESTKSEEKLIIDQVNDEYEQDISNQSGCRAVKTLDGGYDTGETSHKYGVEDGTDDEDDWDDGYESPHDPDENEDDRDKRKYDEQFTNDVEQSQKAEFQGKQGNHKVEFRAKNGKVKQRNENGNERDRRLRKEGDVTGIREGALKRASEAKKRKDAEAYVSDEND